MRNTVRTISWPLPHLARDVRRRAQVMGSRRLAARGRRTLAELITTA